jgi:hypothetical protein
MKSVALLKQRMLYKKEDEGADFMQEKKEALEMKDHLTKVAGFLKAWLEGAKAMQKASKDMAEILQGEDRDLEAIATVVSDGLADTRTGAGVVEVALDSVTRKIGWLTELKKRCDTMETAHLELARANRKLADNKGSTKEATYLADQQRLQAAYTKLKSELGLSFRFVLTEARSKSQSGQTTALGLLQKELTAFKESQVALYRSCYEVTSKFQAVEHVDVANIWTDFQDRRIAAVESAGMGGGNSPSRAQSGRDLFRQGLSGPSGEISRESSQNFGKQPSARAPPPPPPPPPAAAANAFQAMYDYSALGDDELSFSVGSSLTVLDQSDPNWWMAEDQLGNRGLVPSNYLTQA